MKSLYQVPKEIAITLLKKQQQLGFNEKVNNDNMN